MATKKHVSTGRIYFLWIYIYMYAYTYIYTIYDILRYYMSTLCARWPRSSSLSENCMLYVAILQHVTGKIPPTIGYELNYRYELLWNYHISHILMIHLVANATASGGCCHIPCLILPASVALQIYTSLDGERTTSEVEVANKKNPLGEWFEKKRIHAI